MTITSRLVGTLGGTEVKEGALSGTSGTVNLGGGTWLVAVTADYLRSRFDASSYNANTGASLTINGTRVATAKLKLASTGDPAPDISGTFGGSVKTTATSVEISTAYGTLTSYIAVKIA